LKRIRRQKLGATADEVELTGLERVVRHAAQQNRADYDEVNQVQTLFVNGGKAAARALAKDMAARPRRERVSTLGHAA